MNNKNPKDDTQQYTGMCIVGGIQYPMLDRLCLDINKPGFTAYHPPTCGMKVFKTRLDIPEGWICIGEVRLTWFGIIFNKIKNILNFFRKFWSRNEKEKNSH
jgi:hypothetical protein